MLFALFFSLVEVSVAKPSFQIIPKPQKMVNLKKDAWNYTELRQLVLSEGVQRPIMGPMLDLLSEEKQKGKQLVLKLVNKGVPESEEGYHLNINEKGATISARHPKGLFYGCQTLEQIMEDGRDFMIPVPCMEIEDYPAISYRAVHLDTKHHLDRIEYYYQMIDKLAYYKINAVIWELEDKLRYSRHPEIAASNAISKQEMKAICRYAIERNVEISPLVQGLGHAPFILKHHWELREDPKSDWEFCPTNPETYDFLFDMYRDAIEAMPYGRYLHVGGDEIKAIGVDNRCKATGKNAFELQMEWLKRVTSYAESLGRTTIFWDDMPLKYGGVWKLATGKQSEEEVKKLWEKNTLEQSVHLFPKSCIFMRWNYFDPTQPGHQRILKWYKDSGLRVMAATAASAGDSPFIPRDDTRSGYIQNFSKLVYENKLEGILATAWDDGSPHLETVWRGYIAQGDFGWNPNGRTIEEFKKVHAQREYGIEADKNRTAFIKELEEAFFFFDGALVEKGRRNPAWGATSFTLISLPQEGSQGEWSKKYSAKIERAQREEKRYHVLKKEIETTLKQAKRNRYTLQVYQQLNELQHYPTSLILAISAYDQARTETERLSALNGLKDQCNHFIVMRENLENVFSQTRFLSQPEGYVEDFNHHSHLASKTLNFDWMYYYEIPLLEKLQKWMDKQNKK